MTDRPAESSAASPIDFAEMATELVAAYVTKNHVRAAELPGLIATVHSALSGLGNAPKVEPEPVVTKLVPHMPIRKTITDTHIISLEDGKSYQSLKRHLTKHGLTPAEYRAKWGLPLDYPMVAPAYSAKRSELAKSIGLGARRREG